MDERDINLVRAGEWFFGALLLTALVVVLAVAGFITSELHLFQVAILTEVVALIFYMVAARYVRRYNKEHPEESEK